VSTGQRALSLAVGECLRIRDPEQKIAAVAATRAALAAGRLVHDAEGTVIGIDEPGRPEAPELVHPRAVPQRSLGDTGGHVAFLHAVAHIEFTAINLALDAAHRFRDMPVAYYEDWLQVAAEEGAHFGMLQDHLANLGSAYGDLPAHGAMWRTALATRHDVLARMAIIPRGLEARGLDVTPGMMRRLASFGDRAGALILERILHDEIGHVAVGTRWFNWICAARGLAAAPTFFDCLDRYLGDLRMPAPNVEARRQAGFSAEELRLLAAWNNSTWA